MLKKIGKFRFNTDTQRLIKYATVSTEIGRRDKYISNYKKKIIKDIISSTSIILFLLFAVIIEGLEVPLLLTCVIVSFLLLYPIICFIKNIKKIVKNNLQLMYFEGEILKKTEKFEIMPPRGRNNFMYYISLCDGIVIEVTPKEYFNLINTANKIRIYFFRDLLKEHDLFHIEIVD